jgi:hypothetical protein
MKKAFFTAAILLFITTIIFSQETKKANQSDYVGTYSAEKTITILLENERLFVLSEIIPRVELINKGTDKFETKETGYKVEFTRNKEGAVEKILIALPGKPNIEAAKQADKSLNDYVGEYYRTDKEDQSHLFITCENNKLVGEADGGKFEINRLKGDDFEIKELSFGVIFTRNNLGRVDGIRIIRSDGNEITGKKVEKK